MKYIVELTRSATRELRRIPSPYHDRITEALQKLAIDPRPQGSKKLVGMTDLWRIRIGVYRVVYTIGDTIKLVRVERIVHRKDAYK